MWAGQRAGVEYTNIINMLVAPNVRHRTERNRLLTQHGAGEAAERVVRQMENGRGPEGPPRDSVHLSAC